MLLNINKKGELIMNRVLEFQNLIAMLKEIDTEKNSAEALREVLDYIANELEKYIDGIR